MILIANFDSQFAIYYSQFTIFYGYVRKAKNVTDAATICGLFIVTLRLFPG